MFDSTQQMNPSASPTIYLLASAGNPNYGDEFIVRSWLEFLRRAAPGALVWLDAPNPGLCAQLFSDSHPQLRCTDTLWQLAWQVSETVPSTDWPRHVVHHLKHLGTPRLDAGIERLRQVSVFHLLGGGYLNSRWPQNCLVPLATAIASKIYGIPAVASGLGLLPQDTETASLLDRSFKDFFFVESRDNSNQVSEYFPSATSGFDDAFFGLAPDIQHFWYKPQTRTPPRFMLLLQGDQHQDPSVRRRTLDTALNELESAGWTRNDPVGLVEAIPPDDAWALNTLKEELGLEVEFYSFLEIWNNGLPFAPGQFWVSTRFHFHLLAAACGIYGTAISISADYYSPKHRSLIELGTGWKLVDPQGTTLVDANQPATDSFPRVASNIARSRIALALQLLQHPEDHSGLQRLVSEMRASLVGKNASALQ